MKRSSNLSSRGPAFFAGPWRSPLSEIASSPAAAGAPRNDILLVSIVLAFVVWLPVGLPAAPAAAVSSYTLEQVLINLENREKDLAGVKFHFEQDIEFLQMERRETVQGEAVFAKSGKMKIAKTAPQEQLTISNGKKLWIYTPSFGQVWQGTAQDWWRSEMLPKGMVPLSGYVSELKKNFHLQLRPAESAGQVAVNAEPKDPAMGYRMILYISTDSWIPLRTVFVSESASVITKLSALEVNPKISPSLFQFSPPKGTDVIPLN